MRAQSQHYRLHLVNLSFRTFFDLVIRARNLSKDILLPSRSSNNSHSMNSSQNHVATFVEGYEQECDSCYGRKRRGELANEPPSFPCSMKEVITIVKMWIEDGSLIFPKLATPPTSEDKAKENYWLYHHVVKHPNKSYCALCKIFHQTIC